jgi:thymidylate kinase
MANATRRGMLIVVYGPNNIGKTRQLEILQERLKNGRISSRVLKYPVMEVEPTGSVLKRIAKGHESISEEELQKTYAQNRRDFEPTLCSWLDQGVWVLALDYVGSGIAWGIARGVKKAKVEEMNKGLMEPDIAIMLDGPRRGESELVGQLHEDEEDWYKAREVHLELADEYGWVKVEGDASTLTVANRIWAVVKPMVVTRGY